MQLIRAMYRWMTTNNSRIAVTRVTTDANVWADALSRGDVQAYNKATSDRVIPPDGNLWTPREFPVVGLLLAAAKAHRVES